LLRRNWEIEEFGENFVLIWGTWEEHRKRADHE
jgi:hypothetical protein